MTQPNDEPSQGGFGAPQDPPPGGFGAPPTPPPPTDALSKQPPQPPAGGPPAAPPPPGAQPPAPQGPPTPPAGTGGFGAPQEPAPGGHGAPQTPPPPQHPGYGPPQTPPPGQPGYGYPQTPPPGQPGYGYPQTPPQGQPGYAYPQGPAPGQPGMPPQQGYGYPTAPMQQQYAGPQPGGGKKFGTQMKIIVAAAVAVVLIIGGGVIYAAGGDDGDGTKNEASAAGTEGKGGEGGEVDAPGGDEKAPADVMSEVGFQLPLPEVTDTTNVRGSWLTDKAYVKTGAYEIVGYDPAKGTKLWSVPLAGQLCAASRHKSEDDKTAIVFQEGKPTKERKYPSCNKVGVVDLATGKLVWSKSVTSSSGGDTPVRFDEVTLSGTTVAAGGTGGGAAFNLDDGAELWRPKTDTNNCYDMGYGGGEALVAVRKCGSSDERNLTIQPLNPTTGAPLSSYAMPAGVEYAAVVSTKPLVVAADVGDTAGDGSGISDFFSIDAATGELTVRISADADKYAARCGSTEVETCQSAVVGNNKLYLPTERHDGGGEYGNTNEIVAFDLTTGKLVGGKADAGDRYTMRPLRMDGTDVIAYKEPPYDKGGQIVSINGSSFKETVLMENPADKVIRAAETSFSPDYAEFVYEKGRLFIAKKMVSKPRPSSTEDKEYLVVSFTTG
ncbi:PQQ-binding-like beta-propeller repeat protein [Streptomyces sp. NBC_01754]|uniref:outer membrane protein assembly factor BamB family protein n=1 Tax=Streptomyces sp. NBC_01754 TaxID=2975930 RepID=UPI002DD95273|nr:PQQ-binding-like beta-propeller repeat protein [Streptomyces sp. NBC_01754]WSC92924.1 PQQ-binding-like beta-propeller repeat protein [Streptomyces sp. NBC_01754]